MAKDKKTKKKLTTQKPRRPLRVKVSRLAHGQDLALPAYQSELAAGMDLVAAVAEDAPITLEPGARALIPTGLKIALPVGFEAQVRPRSGLAMRDGITVLNSPGTIDADYRGEVQVLLINHGQAVWTVSRGERIAQLVVQRVIRIAMDVVGDLDKTQRGSGGFGSTGVTPPAQKGKRVRTARDKRTPKQRSKRPRRPTKQ